MPNTNVAIIVKKRTYERRHEAPLLASVSDHPNVRAFSRRNKKKAKIPFLLMREWLYLQIVTLHHHSNESKWTVLVEDWLEFKSTATTDEGMVLLDAFLLLVSCDGSSFSPKFIANARY